MAYTWKASSEYASFALAMASTEKTIVVDAPATLSADTTVPATKRLYFLEGATLDLAGYKLTIKGEIDTGYFRIFNTATANSLVIMHPEACEYLIPEWWGGEI